MYYIVEYKAFKFHEVLWANSCHTEDEAKELAVEISQNNPKNDYFVFEEKDILEDKHIEYPEQDNG